MRFTPPKPETGRPRNPDFVSILTVPVLPLNSPISNPVTLVRHGDIAEAVPPPPAPAAKIPEKAP